jgi:hypothetical protein
MVLAYVCNVHHTIFTFPPTAWRYIQYAPRGEETPQAIAPALM